MNMIAKGVIEFIGMKNGNTNVKLGGEWYSFFKEEVVANKGDLVEFSYVQKGNWKNGDASTFKVNSSGSPVSPSSASKEVDWDGKDRRIAYLACRKDAIQITSLLLDSGGIKLPTKIPDKFEVILGVVKQLTDDFYEDVYDVHGYPVQVAKQNNNSMFTEEELDDEE